MSSFDIDELYITLNATQGKTAASWILYWATSACCTSSNPITVTDFQLTSTPGSQATRHTTRWRPFETRFVLFVVHPVDQLIMPCCLQLSSREIHHASHVTS